MTSTCPRCTPSKLPIVSATGPIGLVGSPRWTFRVVSLAEHLVGHECAPQGIGVSERDQAAGQIVGAKQALARLWKDTRRTALANHGLLFDVELDLLHVRQYDFGRKQPGPHVVSGVELTCGHRRLDGQGAVRGPDEAPKVPADAQVAAEIPRDRPEICPASASNLDACHRIRAGCAREPPRATGRPRSPPTPKWRPRSRAIDRRYVPLPHRISTRATAFEPGVKESSRDSYTSTSRARGFGSSPRRASL